MSLSSIGPIEAAVHTTNVWLKELLTLGFARSKSGGIRALTRQAVQSG
jgi:hypothetical protein